MGYRFKDKVAAEAKFYEEVYFHKKYISKIFNKYGKGLCEEFDVDYDKLAHLVENHDVSKIHNEEEKIGYMSYAFVAEDDNREYKDRLALYRKTLKKHKRNNTHHYEYFIDIMNRPIVIPMIHVIEIVLNWMAMIPSGNFKEDAMRVIEESNMLNPDINIVCMHPKSKEDARKVLEFIINYDS